MEVMTVVDKQKERDKIQYEQLAAQTDMQLKDSVVLDLTIEGHIDRIQELDRLATGLK